MVYPYNRILAIVLVSQGYHNNHHRLGGFNNINLFLTVLGAGKSKIKVLKGLVSYEASLLGSEMVPSCCALRWSVPVCVVCVLISLLIRTPVILD